MNNLKIIALNVNSIVSIHRRLNLLKFLNKHNPDIMLLSETKLKAKHYIEFEQYHVVRQDRQHTKQGGGTAILVHNKFKYQHITIDKLLYSAGLETTIIKIKFKNQAQLYIISVYCSSSSNTSIDAAFEKEWKQLFEILKLNNNKNYYVIAGDLNARHANWGNSINNARGIKVNRWINENDIIYRAKLFKPNAPTLIRSGNYLDLAIVDARLNINTNILDEIPTHSYDSDHKAIEIECTNLWEIDDTTNNNRNLAYNFHNI